MGESCDHLRHDAMLFTIWDMTPCCLPSEIWRHVVYHLALFVINSQPLNCFHVVLPFIYVFICRIIFLSDFLERLWLKYCMVVCFSFTCAHLIFCHFVSCPLYSLFLPFQYVKLKHTHQSIFNTRTSWDCLALRETQLPFLSFLEKKIQNERMKKSTNATNHEHNDKQMTDKNSSCKVRHN